MRIVHLLATHLVCGRFEQKFIRLGDSNLTDGDLYTSRLNWCLDSWSVWQEEYATEYVIH